MYRSIHHDLYVSRLSESIIDMTFSTNRNNIVWKNQCWNPRQLLGFIYHLLNNGVILIIVKLNSMDVVVLSVKIICARKNHLHIGWN